MTHLTAKKGHVFARKDKTAVYGKNLYLSSIDAADNYVELTEKEGASLKEELEKKALEGLHSL